MNDVDEAVAALVAEVAVVDQNFRGRADHRHAVEHLVDLFAQERVVRQAVRQDLGADRRFPLRPCQGGEAPGPAGKAPDQFAGLIGFDLGVFQGGQVRDLQQFGAQALFGDAAQVVQGHPQSLRQLTQQAPGDGPFVPFDQVQVAGRDADTARQGRLGHALVPAVLPDARSGNWINHLKFLFFPQFVLRCSVNR